MMTTRLSTNQTRLASAEALKKSSEHHHVINKKLIVDNDLYFDQDVESCGRLSDMTNAVAMLEKFEWCNTRKHDQPVTDSAQPCSSEGTTII